MKLKYVGMDDALYRYLCSCRSNSHDPSLSALRKETDSLGEISRMQISQEQGSFLTLLTAAVGAQSALEVGTFTGYSSICIARGLRPGGKLICIDASREWTDIARRFWKKAGVERRIDLRLGSAIPILKSFPAKPKFELAFIDAEKTEYDAYYELVLPRLRQNGIILFDNMLWGGRLGRGKVAEDSGRAIDMLNRKLAKDPRIESVLLPIADGLHVCRKI